MQSYIIQKVAVIIPAYNAGTTILDVVQGVLDLVDFIIVVDDACPNRSGEIVSRKFEGNKKVIVITSNINTGVGGATIVGMRYARKIGAEVLIKIDSDNQMDPTYISKYAAILKSGSADYVKGNRFFFIRNAKSMPRIRFYGNLGLGLLSKISTGQWFLNDFTNGYIGINGKLIDRIEDSDLEMRYFFETSMLYNLYLLSAKIVEVPMKAIYFENGSSGLSPIYSLYEFSIKNIKMAIKRILIAYYLREISFGSIMLMIGLKLMIFSMIYSLYLLKRSIEGELASNGSIYILTVSTIMAFQSIIVFLAEDFNRSRVNESVSDRL
jgi:dolichol-phosphate mannosyltransferase